MIRTLNPSVLIVGGGPCGMLMSSLLSRYGIDSALVEKGGEDPVSHPRAHVLNARSMEILRKMDLERKVQTAAPPKEDWVRFRYCEKVETTEDLAMIDHSTTPEAAAIRSKSPSRVTQLSQPMLEKIIRRDAHDKLLSSSSINYHYEVINIDFPSKVVQVKSVIDGSIMEVKPNVVVASDGARSICRQQSGIAFNGRAFIESFASVHFMSPSLARFLRAKNKAAMLTFVFNPSIVAGVFVAHDVRGDGNFVAHIPFFPPTELPEQFERRSTVEPLLAALLGKPPSSFDIKSVRAWGMHANLAAEFASKDNFVALVGDAAHQFPPSGGFGVNVGISEVDDLAFRLHKYGCTSRAVNQYSRARRPIAKASLDVALQNYERGLLPAKALGLERSTMATASSVLNAVLGQLPQIPASSIMRTAASAPVAMALRGERITGRLRKAVENDRSALPMFFPQVDLGADLVDGRLRTAAETDLKIGALLPHVYMRVLDERLDGRVVSSRDLSSPFYNMMNQNPVTDTVFVFTRRLNKDNIAEFMQRFQTKDENAKIRFVLVMESDEQVEEFRSTPHAQANTVLAKSIGNPEEFSPPDCRILAIQVDGTGFVSRIETV